MLSHGCFPVHKHMKIDIQFMDQRLAFSNVIRLELNHQNYKWSIYQPVMICSHLNLLGLIREIQQYTQMWSYPNSEQMTNDHWREPPRMQSKLLWAGNKKKTAKRKLKNPDIFQMIISDCYNATTISCDNSIMSSQSPGIIFEFLEIRYLLISIWPNRLFILSYNGRWPSSRESIWNIWAIYTLLREWRMVKSPELAQNFISGRQKQKTIHSQEQQHMIIQTQDGLWKLHIIQ